MAHFDVIYGFDESGLDQRFRLKYRDRLINGSRGFGYWCWKPQVILQILDKMEKGDILQYTDAGCHLNRAGRWRLTQYFDMAEESPIGIIAFQGKPPSRPLPPLPCAPLDLTESRWTKGDLLDHLGVRSDRFITGTQTIGAGVIFVRKCDSAVEIIREWAAIIDGAFELLDDTPSKSPNEPGFVEHRHDQAIFSLLCKKRGVETLSSYEYWYPKPDAQTPDWDVLSKYPVHAKRDRGGALMPLISSVRRLGRQLLRASEGAR